VVVAGKPPWKPCPERVAQRAAGQREAERVVLVDSRDDEMQPVTFPEDAEGRCVKRGRHMDVVRACALPGPYTTIAAGAVGDGRGGARMRRSVDARVRAYACDARRREQLWYKFKKSYEAGLYGEFL
jgi:hypothetical protein